MAHILEFQLHKSLCIEAGQYDPNDPAKPLHKCDIDGSKKVGEMISKGLALGSSKHWSEALKEMTGDTKISAAAIREYFKPLEDFLKEVNDRSNDEIMEETLLEYNQAASVMTNKMVSAEWAVATDTNNKELAEELSRVTVENAKFVNKWYENHFKHFKPSDFKDESIQRQIRLLTTRGINTLSESKLVTVSL